MNEPLVDQLVYDPTFNSIMVHSLPHISFDMGYVDDTFNPHSTEYIVSLLIIGLVPIVLVFFGLFVVAVDFLQKRAVKLISQTTDTARSQCLCTLKKLMRFCIIMLALVALCEVMVHIAIIRSLPKITLPDTDSMRAFQQLQIKKVETICSEVSPSKKKFPDPTGILPVQFRTPKVDEKIVAHIHQQYRRIAIDINTAGANVKRPQLSTQRVHTPFAVYTILGEWCRFVIYMLVWIMAIVVCATKYRRAVKGGLTATCGLCGVVFCSFAAAMVIIAAVAVADACQNPSAAVAFFSSKARHERFLRREYGRICNSFRIAMDDSIKKFQSVVLNSRGDSIRTVVANGLVMTYAYNRDNTGFQWPSHDTNSTRSYENNFRYVRNIHSHINNVIGKLDEMDWKEVMECVAEDDYLDNFVFVPDDARPACKGDRVLCWLLLQVFLLMLACIAFGFIIRTQLSKRL